MQTYAPVSRIASSAPPVQCDSLWRPRVAASADVQSSRRIGPAPRGHRLADISVHAPGELRAAGPPSPTFPGVIQPDWDKEEVSATDHGNNPDAPESLINWREVRSPSRLPGAVLLQIF